MLRKLVIAAVGATAVLFPTAVLALGTAADAKAMLEKTVAAIKANKTKTLNEINAGTNGFLVGDIYPFCWNLSDGKVVAVANPNAKKFIGTDIRTNKDATGKAFGRELYAAAQKPQGQILKVSYSFPSPAPTRRPSPK